MSAITTITFFRFSGMKNKFWAFRMMGMAPQRLKNVYGQRFFKLMGSGMNDGFHPLPDWKVYALLQCWESEAEADRFFHVSGILDEYENRSEERWTVYLKGIEAKGLWSGNNPFPQSEDLDPENKYIAVLTRATIKTKYLIPFWWFVPKAKSKLQQNPGLIYAKGVGELPFVQMATFSLWKNKEALNDFAYNTENHKKAIEKTRKLDWYSEEMFSRFQPYREEGTWDGKERLMSKN